MPCPVDLDLEALAIADGRAPWILILYMGHESPYMDSVMQVEPYCVGRLGFQGLGDDMTASGYRPMQLCGDPSQCCHGLSVSCVSSPHQPAHPVLVTR
jgi:hypothetical protein